MNPVLIPIGSIMDANKNRQPVRRAPLLAGAGVAVGIFLACACLPLQAASPTSLKAGGKYAVIDCILAECSSAEAVDKVVAMIVKNSAMRKGSQGIPGELGKLSGVRFFSSGRTYAPIETESSVGSTRAVADGGGAMIHFDAFPMVTPDGVTLIIRRRLKEIAGAMVNIGASVRSDGDNTIVTLRHNGLVVLDSNETRHKIPRREQIYLLSANLVQADANGNLPASAPVPGISGGPDGLEGEPSIKQRAARLRIPSVELKDATMVEMIEYFRAQAKQHDPTGVGITLHLSEGAAKSNVRVTLSLKKASLTQALAEVLKKAEPVVELCLHQEDNSFQISTRDELEYQLYIPARSPSTQPDLKQAR